MAKIFLFHLKYFLKHQIWWVRVVFFRLKCNKIFFNIRIKIRANSVEHLIPLRKATIIFLASWQCLVEEGLLRISVYVVVSWEILTLARNLATPCAVPPFLLVPIA